MLKVITATDAAAAAAILLHGRSVCLSVCLSAANACYQGGCRPAGSQLIRNSSPGLWHVRLCAAPTVTRDICTVCACVCVCITCLLRPVESLGIRH